MGLWAVARFFFAHSIVDGLGHCDGLGHFLSSCPMDVVAHVLFASSLPWGFHGFQNVYKTILATKNDCWSSILPLLE